jgi:arabinogalactan oligomer/maltooligosaccharide transport system permease protein
MNYIDYVQLNPFQKFGYNFVKFFKALPGNLKKIFCAIGRFFKRIFLTIGKGFAGYFSRFVKGDWATKCSYLVMGVGNASKGQLVKGFLFLLVEVAYILFMVFFGWGYLVKFPTLGTVSPVDENGRRVKGIVPDNSMLTLLYGVMTIIVTVLFFCVYIANTKSAYKAQQTVAEGKKPIGFKDEIKALLAAHGADRLTEIDPGEYDAMMTEAEGIGR